MIFLPQQPPDDYYRYLSASTVLLNSPYYTGEITTLDSFVYDVPGVAENGNFLVQRYTAAYYETMELSELVHGSVAQWADCAVRLGTDPEYRQHILQIQSRESQRFQDQSDTVRNGNRSLRLSYRARLVIPAPYVERRSEMRKILALFFGCPGGFTTPIRDVFRQAGMLCVGPDTAENQQQAEEIHRLNQRLHTAIYGFPEGEPGLSVAGRIYRNRRILLPEITQLPEEWIREGIRVIQALTDSSPVSGLFQSGLTLFHDYWHHVLSHFPEISVHQLFILQPPGEILFHLVRQSSERPTPVEILDFLMAYYLRLLQIRKQWKGSSRVIHPTSTTYASDLRRALEQNGLLREGMPHIEHVVPVPSGGEFPILNHPIELTYEKILASFM